MPFEFALVAAFAARGTRVLSSLPPPRAARPQVPATTCERWRHKGGREAGKAPR
jgi:hypothetical protein